MSFVDPLACERVTVATGRPAGSRLKHPLPLPYHLPFAKSRTSFRDTPAAYSVTALYLSRCAVLLRQGFPPEDGTGEAGPGLGTAGAGSPKSRPFGGSRRQQPTMTELVETSCKYANTDKTRVFSFVALFLLATEDIRSAFLTPSRPLTAERPHRLKYTLTIPPSRCRIYGLLLSRSCNVASASVR